MDGSKYSKLVRALVERTESHTLKWKDMPDENSFQTILATGSVVVRKTFTYDLDDQRVEYIQVTVLDKNGRVADEHTSLEEDESAATWELFQKARSAARNSEGIIASLLNEIG